jgi:Leucine-rich repeat (LRR) protein
MHGEFPIGIFMLSNLRVLYVNYNKDLTCSWYDFQYWSSPLEEISLGVTSFSGELPASMENLRSLVYLNFWECNFSGNISSSIGTLTNLIMIDLANNSLAGNIPSSIGNLIQLVFVDLDYNHLTGPIFFGLANLTQLVLNLGCNRLIGLIPSSINNLTKLYMLGLSKNEFQGQFPISTFNLKFFNILDIANKVRFLVIESRASIPRVPYRLVSQGQQIR